MNVKKLIPIQHAEALIQRLERMNTNFIEHWREELQRVADDVTEIPSDQVQLANELEQGRNAISVLQQIQQCYPGFCSRHDAGKWVAWGLGQSKEPMYGPESEFDKISAEKEKLENFLKAAKKEIEDLVSQLCDFDKKWEAIQDITGCVAGHELGSIEAQQERIYIESASNDDLKRQVYELRKQLDAAKKLG